MASKELPWSIRILKNSDIYKKQIYIYKINWDSNSAKMGDRCSLNYDIIHDIYIKLTPHWHWFCIKDLCQITLWKHTESNAPPWTDTLVYDRWDLLFLTYYFKNTR